MTKLYKLAERIKAKPKDFTWNELCALMKHYDYVLDTSGGSRRKFYNLA